MASAYLRYQRYLLCQKIGFFLLFTLGSTISFAQTVVRENYVKYDQRRLRFGFYLAPSLAGYRVQHSQAYVDQIRTPGLDQTLQINGHHEVNFGLGFIINTKLHEYIDFRMLPGVGFYRRFVEYDGVNVLGRPLRGGKEDKLIESTMVELPLLFKFKSKRRRNVRMYFVGGLKPSVNVSDRKQDGGVEEDRFRGKKNDLSIEYGVGADLYYPFFKFGPELRFSHGLPNMLIADPSPYARSLQRLSTHNVTLLLQFE
jgi:hypothetical protein